MGGFLLTLKKNAGNILFYGIVVLMYYYDTKQHNLLHIHVQYGEFEAIISIPDGTILEGNLPKNKLKLIFGVDRDPPGRFGTELEACGKRREAF